MTRPSCIVDVAVAGVPVPQGSMKAYNGHVTHSNGAKLRPWRQDLVETLRGTRGLTETGPVRVELWFQLPRPKGHYGKRGNLLPSAPKRPTVRPDLDKLERAVLDALTLSGVIRDDAQVVELHSDKAYAASVFGPGVSIIVEAWR